ncbi:bacillithiol biosynthesis deacetylase BshB2 [Ferroacidibacillus organovorans]|uniref:Bacillithiol biosynthesis deacetylase BshB2 n=1 Tax=Ferroacidibacillus organovorans TaxID=1765683 RepID=A0A162TJ13_9BACL|nr:bacillithiol biosynthesis deacetylase BshB2 [Ferroacidibacillus organovorans]KYP80854.1 bacillithiol biosynthesis deacetylase BshB2 [Ferroacidibacillus organovorans]OAG95399.1 bacillithiol biosynthesis deacetylase BshB2 [Ferroacidibacillus organovorans]OPG15764.1 bacillithiol biosynthesis deacetylase BshB2 [Ferroacidibacillus organovorans]
MERHVLVVFPHPDDETFGTGGTIASFTKAGVPVTYACGTLGQMGRNMGKPFFATRETLSEVREKELRAACDALGIKDLRLLGLRDKTIEFEDREVIADQLLSIIEELNPSLIITHYPGFAVHPDHNALGAACVRAVEKLPVAKRPVVYGHAFARNREEFIGSPDVTIDIHDVAETKLEAVRAHRSQSENVIARFEEALKNKEAAAQFGPSMFTESFYTMKFA